MKKNNKNGWGKRTRTWTYLLTGGLSGQTALSTRPRGREPSRLTAVGAADRRQSIQNFTGYRIQPAMAINSELYTNLLYTNVCNRAEKLTPPSVFDQFLSNLGYGEISPIAGDLTSFFPKFDLVFEIFEFEISTSFAFVRFFIFRPRVLGLVSNCANHSCAHFRALEFFLWDHSQHW